MKKNKVLKIVLIVLGVLLALVLAAAAAIGLYLKHLASTLPDTLPEDGSASVVQPELTDEDLDKLFSGEISLDDLTAGAASTPEEGASASVPAEDASSAAESEAADSTSAAVSPSGAASGGSASSSSAASSSASSGSASSSSGSTASSSSASSKTEAPYEAEIKALLQQLYSTKARAEADLNACVAGAKAEYKALPESQQTQARKMSIVLARSSKLYAMQAAYDKKVEGIVSQMRAVLTANGQSTALADQAMASYKAQKSATYSRLVSQLYS